MSLLQEESTSLSSSGMNDNTQQLPTSSSSTSTTTGSSSSTSNDVLSLESIRLQIVSHITRIQRHVSIDTIRPLPIFLGLQSADTTITNNNSSNNNSDLSMLSIAPNAYTTPIIPTTPSNNSSVLRKNRTIIYDMIQSRIQTNLIYYRSNYACIAIMTAIIIFIMHPSIIIIGCIVYGIWKLHTLLIRREIFFCYTNISVNSILTVQQRFYICFTISIILIIFTCIIPTILWIIVSSILILTHATLRNTSSVPQLHDLSQRSKILSTSTSSSTSISYPYDTTEKDTDPLLSSSAV